MSTRLHALGFAAEWTPAIADRLLELAETKGRAIETERGRYRLWRTREGAELWFHYPHTEMKLRLPRQGVLSLNLKDLASGLAPKRTITAVTPFHRGLSSCTIKIGRELALDRSNPLEGSVLAWLPPVGKNGRAQVIVLELAPFALQPQRKPPYMANAQILCCAHAVWAYPDKAGYERQTPANRRIRPGAYAPVSETDVPEVGLTYRYSPITLGLATGVVKRAIRHVNPATGAPYYWLLLETLRGTFDVVVNSEAVTGDISEGHIAQVCGSFLARLEGAKV